MKLMTELGIDKPGRRKFANAISHIFTTKNTQRKHLLRRQLRLKIGMKIFTSGLSKRINVVTLHEIIDNNFPEHEIIIEEKNEIAKKKVDEKAFLS